ncbi:MAG TPA: LLM class F420-dependent oxidoreductase [Candidatus Binataceae bacterium]|nr:LLM class F420-dependent oxidoreductase [Candidatus Binataceae bacterium]
MKFGLFGINMRPCDNPLTAVRVARAAEEAGFDSVWTGEHIVLADPQTSPSPMPPDVPFVDSAVALAFVAGHTKVIKLATGIIILPQRNPVVLAKELASVDVVSGGRLICGFGIGSLAVEFGALGVPFENKGKRAEEYIRAMKALWTMEKPEFRGRFVSFSGVRAEPRPSQKPHPPIIFGGNSPYAFSRTARLGDGWFGFALDRDRTVAYLDGIRQKCKRFGRSFDEIEISVTPRARVDYDVARQYADLGVNRIVLYSRARDEQGVWEFIRNSERELISRM